MVANSKKQIHAAYVFLGNELAPIQTFANTAVCTDCATTPAEQSKAKVDKYTAGLAAWGLVLEWVGGWMVDWMDGWGEGREREGEKC